MAGYASRFIVIADFRYSVSCSELSTKEVVTPQASPAFCRGGNRDMEGLSDLGQYLGGFCFAFVLKGDIALYVPLEREVVVSLVNRARPRVSLL